MISKIIKFPINQTEKNYNGAFQYTTSRDRSWIHNDGWNNWAAVLYLTPNAPVESGTLLFKEDVELVKKLREPKPSGKKKAEVMTNLGNVYNRLVLWRGSEIPHRSNLAGFGDCLENGRLTQVFFFDEV